MKVSIVLGRLSSYAQAWLMTGADPDGCFNRPWTALFVRTPRAGGPGVECVQFQSSLDGSLRTHP